MTMKELKKRAIEKSPLCVGIDLRENQIPLAISNGTFEVEEHFVAYAKAIVDNTKEYAACYKVQIACYEAYGLAGLRAYARILNYIRSQGEIVIADIKRGDIGSTAEMYAQGHFTGDFEADIVTLNAYMGKDAVSPYFSYFKQGKGAFILGKTSNPGSKDFQDLKVNQTEQTLSQNVLDTIYQWGKECDTGSELPCMGAVVGVNNIADIHAMKSYTDKLFLLVPGYGAQGAKIEDIRTLIADRQNGVVNVSRGMTAGIVEEKEFEQELRRRAQQFAKELLQCINK